MAAPRKDNIKEKILLATAERLKTHPLAELSLTARTTAGEAGARIDGAENIADLSAMDEPARQAWFERMREAASQAVFTVMGRLPKEAAAALLEKMQ